MKTTHIPALFGLVMLALVVGLELNQPPPTLLNPDPYAINSVDRELVRFHGLPIGAGKAAVRTAFGAPDRVYTDINDFTGNSEVWVYGRSEVTSMKTMITWPAITSRTPATLSYPPDPSGGRSAMAGRPAPQG